MQGMLLLAHWFLYETLTSFLELSPNLHPHALWTLRIAAAVLSISFVGASLLAFRSANILMRVLYTVAAMWLGALTYLFLAACTMWIVYGVSSAAGVPLNRPYLAASLFSAALLISVYGIINASWTRVTRVTFWNASRPGPVALASRLQHASQEQPRPEQRRAKRHAGD